MEKMPFQIRRETREPGYQFTETNKSKPPVGILIFMALLTLGGAAACDSSCGAKAGVIAYHPLAIKSSTDAYIHIANYANDEWNLDLVKDYPLKITHDGKTVTFIADGYDISNKIAYEWVESPEYHTNFSDDTQLSPAEIGYLQDYRFGDYYIAPIKGKDYDTLDNELWEMMSSYMSDHPNKNPSGK
ncbi:MAG: hypothetical protein HPY53_05705 [Brevinematales bacterium]|nr:hypothetical protein [Brevinematales bacterium]